MGSVMTTLLGIVQDITALDAEATIYAEQPWTKNSKAAVAREADTGGPPEDLRNSGLVYFLEVAVARDFLEGWASNLGRTPPIQESCDRLIQYAINDA